MLYFLRRSMSYFHSPLVKLSLYTSLICSKLSYCSQVWRPHLVKDISKFEQVQHRATKFILNDFTSLDFCLDTDMIKPRISG